MENLIHQKYNHIYFSFPKNHIFLAVSSMRLYNKECILESFSKITPNLKNVDEI